MVQIVVIDPDILGGEPVFSGTRVPVKILFDYLEGDHTIMDFLEQYPSVSKQLALDTLRLAENSITISA